MNKFWRKLIGLRAFPTDELLETLDFLSAVNYNKIEPDLAGKTDWAKRRIGKELLRRGVIFWEETEEC